MAMSVDSRQQQPQLNALGYDPLRATYAVPQFTNPWVTASGPSGQLYPTTSQSTSAMDGLSHAQQRPTSISLPFSNLAVTASPLPAAYDTTPVGTSQDLLNSSRNYAAAYTGAPAPTSYLPTAGTAYAAEYAAGRHPYAYADTRRPHPSVPSTILCGPLDQGLSQSSLIDLDRMNSQPRNSFSDALDASQGMVAMSQDITPRNIYGNQGSRSSSSDSYGFPAPHSAHSSISSASTYPSYYNPSVAESSVSDYSSASESVEMNSRTLPRPSALMGANIPPAPQSMMGQFSSKVSSSSQKKHKCKICDKRFTRPSSLQTHMYSHTGEKRESILQS